MSKQKNHLNLISKTNQKEFLERSSLSGDTTTGRLQKKRESNWRALLRFRCCCIRLISLGQSEGTRKLMTNNALEFVIRHSSIAYICVAECILENFVKFVMAVIYVSSGQKIINMKVFISRSVFECLNIPKNLLGYLSSTTKKYNNYH